MDVFFVRVHVPVVGIFMPLEISLKLCLLTSPLAEYY